MVTHNRVCCWPVVPRSASCCRHYCKPVCQFWLLMCRTVSKPSSRGSVNWSSTPTQTSSLQSLETNVTLKTCERSSTKVISRVLSLMITVC